MTEYNVVLLDADTCEIVNDVVEGLPAAKKHAKYLLTEDYTRRIGTSHKTLGTNKVEVRRASGICEWDAFL